MTRRLVTWGALTIGLVLFVVALSRVDLRALAAVSTRLALALPLVILINGASQVLRTMTWRWCFPPGAHVPFRRLLRIRLAAEAFSYVTVSGVAGEPLKVVLLRDEAPVSAVTASVILERLSFAIVTLMLIGVWAGITLVAVPLPPHWHTVFFSFAVGAALLTMFVALLVVGEGTYVSRGLAALARATRGVLGTHALGRFLVRVEQEVLAFARSGRRRVVRVLAADAVNYLLMAAEVWVILRALGAPSGFGTALTIETFTRVVSVAAAPIPAGIGALEASHLAVAAAVGLPSAGAAIALARRVRGLFWAGVGFAIYPRKGRSGSDASRRRHDQPGRTLLYVADHPAVTLSPLTRLGGLPLAERVLRPAGRDGYIRVIAWAPQSGAQLEALAARLGADAPPLIVARTEAEWVGAIQSEETTSYQVVEPGMILRPRLRVHTATDLPGAEHALRQSVFKATDGVVARFNRRLSLPISLLLIRTPITANQISITLVGLGLWSAWLFSQGTYAAVVMGASVSLAASILDGCDGEIARLKYQESAFGCWLETIGDYLYYVAIFIGLMIGAVRATGNPVFYTLGALALGGFILTASCLLFLRQRATGGRPEQFGALGKASLAGNGWRKCVQWLSVCATRAVMPYGILLLAVLGLAPLVVVLAAIGSNIYWIVLAARFRAWLVPASPVFGAGEP